MRVRHTVSVLVALVAGLVATGAALGVGPWPGLAGAATSPDGTIRYTAARSGDATTVRARRVGGDVIASARLDGAWGIPAVTSTGLAGGLSPDGKRLVLSEPATYQGLRSQSTFLVLATRTLALKSRIVLKGEFGFDALSPDGRTLYVIEHRSRADLVSYVVRGYDLRSKHLLARPIVAKGEGTTMRGYPVARATSAHADWVYTLYHRMEGEPFIHALNTTRRFAVCIDLTWRPGATDVWKSRLALSPDGRLLRVRSGSVTVATVDTKTYRVR